MFGGGVEVEGWWEKLARFYVWKLATFTHYTSVEHTRLSYQYLAPSARNMLLKQLTCVSTRKLQKVCLL